VAWDLKIFEEKMTPYIDKIYKGLFSGIESIDRSSINNTKNLLLDKELGIDSILYFNDGSLLTIQEKTRKFESLAFNDFTFEYYNDPEKKYGGEWFKLASQLYFYGYANENEDSYIKYCILKVVDFRIFLKKELGINELQKYLKSNKKHGKANFFTIPFKVIPDKCFLYQSKVF
jgi:hypothetical protein